TTIPLPLPDSYNQSVLPAGLLLPLRWGPGRRAHGFRRQSLLLLLVHVGIAFCGARAARATDVADAATGLLAEARLDVEPRAHVLRLFLCPDELDVGAVAL